MVMDIKDLIENVKWAINNEQPHIAEMYLREYTSEAIESIMEDGTYEDGYDEGYRCCMVENDISEQDDVDWDNITWDDVYDRYSETIDSFVYERVEDEMRVYSQDSYDRGYEIGYSEGREAGYENGYEEGYETGKDEYS
jgi:flagellar biosynthesis/type III secretory pathway protein FliH